MININNNGKETDDLISFMEKGPAPEGYAASILTAVTEKTKTISQDHCDAPDLRRLWTSALVMVGKSTPGLALRDAQSALSNPVLKQRSLDYIAQHALTLPVSDDYKERSLRLAAKSADQGSPLEAKLASDWASLFARDKAGTANFASDPKFLAAAAWTNSSEGSALRREAGKLTQDRVVPRFDAISRRPYFELVRRPAPV